MESVDGVFPWGVYIGDLVDESETIPLLVDSSHGGFCLLFDDEESQISDILVENVALSLLEVKPLGSLMVDVFDFGKKRFMYLSALSECGVYNIAFSSNKASMLFDELEELTLSRQHNLLDFETPTLSEYNKLNSQQEPFHLLLLNLDDFPEEFTSVKRVKNFLDSAFEAGFYIISFGSKALLSTKNKATKAVLSKFPHIETQGDSFHLSKEIFEQREILDAYEFDYLNQNRSAMTKKLLSLHREENRNDDVQDFLSIPIGKIGTKDLLFEMGLKSMNYHVFIAGMTGTGKTNLLNNIIVSIAKNYTAKEIELYLMDYKPMGAEFGIFKNHPNCKKLFLDNQDPSLAIDMLKEFQATMYERGKLLGGKNIDEYNQLNPQKPLPRKLLIIDEVQRMFGGEWRESNEFNALLEDIVKAGRSFGLHLILTTQSLKEVNLKASIMTQIPLKLSFRLSDEMEAMKIFNDNKDATKRAPKLKPYHFIYSDFRKTVTAKAVELKKSTIEPSLQQAKENRKEDEVLTAEIIVPKEGNVKEDLEKQVSTPKVKDSSYEVKYGTDKDKELLEKLKQMEQ